MKIRYLLLGVLPIALTACSPDSQQTSKFTAATEQKAEASAAKSNAPQWYTFEQTGRGYKLYQASCAECHGKQGEGAVNWQQVGADGKYPPPPLNGTGHAWHHPKRALFYTVKKGSPGGKGNMPAWEGKLTDEEIVDILAWMQSNWPDELYQAWAKNDASSRNKKKG